MGPPPTTAAGGGRGTSKFQTACAWEMQNSLKCMETGDKEKVRKGLKGMLVRWARSWRSYWWVVASLPVHPITTHPPIITVRRRD